MQATATALAGACQLGATATAQAWPTPAPSRVVSHAARRVAEITAEERDGQLTITIELIPEL